MIDFLKNTRPHYSETNPPREMSTCGSECTRRRRSSLPFLFNSPCLPHETALPSELVSINNASNKLHMFARSGRPTLRRVAGPLVSNVRGCPIRAFSTQPRHGASCHIGLRSPLSTPPPHGIGVLDAETLQSFSMSYVLATCL